MINQFSLGLSALRAAQYGLSVTGQNVANANTPGYHRQLAQFVNRPSVTFGRLEFGTGVDVSQIRRMQFSIVEQALTENITAREDLTAQLEISRQVESILAPGPGSLSDRLDNLFNGLEELSGQPHDPSARQSFILTAVNLTTTFHSISGDLDDVTNEIDNQLRDIVDRMNLQMRDIVDLNTQIRKVKASGGQPNDLLDRRDALVNELAQFVDVELDRNDDTVLLADGTVLAGRNIPREIEVRFDADGVFLTQDGGEHRLTFGGGKVAGLLEIRNEMIPSLHQRLTEITHGLIATIDAQHVQGLGIDGPFRRLVAGRPVNDVAIPLAELDTVPPVTAGSLTIGIVDTATGERQSYEISIDPQVDTLDSLAAKITALDHLQAVTNPRTGELSLVADAGYGFEFTGRPETRPDASGLSGTASPWLDGIFTGDKNGNLQFVFLGDGEVGVTPGLEIQVQDASGNPLKTIDVGQGYSPGTSLDLSNGLALHLASGSAVAGESFSTRVVANADTAGVLTALGLNTLFVGTSARNLEVSQRLREDANQLATSLTGHPGDAQNLTRMIARRSLLATENNSLTVEQFSNRFVTQIGIQVQNLTRATDGLDILGENLAAQQAGISGVDPNEEAVHMLEFQRSFQAAAKYLSAVDQTTRELFLLLG